jgi:hypothetical protein
MRGKYEDVKEPLLDWLTTPTRDREPRRREDLAASLGISPATLRRYEAMPAHQHELKRRLAKMNVNPERTQSIIDEWYRMSTDMNLSPKDRLAAGQTYMRYIGQFEPANRKNVVGEAETPVEDMTEEELAQVVNIHAVS